MEAEMSDERCALVLEGGAMRGMYTAGVLDCFMDHDISFDAVIGVSAGALFGGLTVTKIIWVSGRFFGRKT